MSLRLQSCRPSGLAAACLLLASQSALAQSAASDDPVRLAQAAAPALPTVVVTATRAEQPLTDVLADVTLIDEAEIRRSGAVSVSDLLQRQPGFELSRKGGPGTSTSLFLRGADNRFTAVYIDGVRVDTQTTGGAPWEAIALGQVERIEIVRGPAAAVYGSDAVAGVVQIFTKKGNGPFSPYVGIGLGSHSTKKAEAGFSGQHGVLDYALGATREISHGFDSRPGTNPDRDGYRSSSASGRLGLQLNAAHRLEASGTFSDMKGQYDGFTPGQHDVSQQRLSTLGGAWAAQWSKEYSTRLSVSESRQRYETAPDLYRTETTLRNYLLQNEWRRGGHLITAALERREDALANPALNPWDNAIDRDRHQNAIALGYGYSAGAHTLQLNARYDRDSEFGGESTGGIAYGYGFAPGWRVTAAAGTAFRVPTLYQRFSEYGQPALQPEKSRNLELGLRWSQGSSHFGVTAYRNKVRNLITFGAAGPCGSAFGCYENTGRALLQGVTISGAHRLAGVNLGGSLDLQNPKDDVTDKLLARRAKRLLKLNADTRVGDWTLGTEWRGSSKRYDDAANTRRLGGYGVLSLYASATLAREWQLLARIDNLADKDHQLARGYATAGRTFHVGLRWTPR